MPYLFYERKLFIFYFNAIHQQVINMTEIIQTVEPFLCKLDVVNVSDNQFSCQMENSWKQSQKFFQFHPHTY